MNKYKNILISILIIAAGFLVYGYVKSRPNLPNQTQQPSADANNNLETKTNEESGLIIEVTPISFKPTKPLQFEIKFTTHQGDLNFDLLKQTILIDNKNATYTPLSWDGGSGGHHLEGTLAFPALSAEIKSIKLVIKDIYEVNERVFEWNLE